MKLAVRNMMKNFPVIVKTDSAFSELSNESLFLC